MLTKFADLKHIDDLLRGRKTSLRALEKTNDPDEANRILKTGIPNPPIPHRLNRFFNVWIMLVVVVTFQMSWVLRPLIGDPETAFTWFSPRDPNALPDFFNNLGALFGG